MPKKQKETVKEIVKDVVKDTASEKTTVKQDQVEKDNLQLLSKKENKDPFKQDVINPLHGLPKGFLKEVIKPTYNSTPPSPILQNCLLAKYKKDQQLLELITTNGEKFYGNIMGFDECTVYFFINSLKFSGKVLLWKDSISSMRELSQQAFNLLIQDQDKQQAITRFKMNAQVLSVTEDMQEGLKQRAKIDKVKSTKGNIITRNSSKDNDQLKNQSKNNIKSKNKINNKGKNKSKQINNRFKAKQNNSQKMKQNKNNFRKNTSVKNKVTLNNLAQEWKKKNPKRSNF